MWIDNVEGRFVRVAPEPGVWVDLLPFRAVVNSIELEDVCVLIYLEGPPDDPAIAVFEYDGNCLWSRPASELPMHDVPGRYGASRMSVPGGWERRLNRGNAWCIVDDWRTPRFGPVQHRVARPGRATDQ